MAPSPPRGPSSRCTRPTKLFVSGSASISCRGNSLATCEVLAARDRVEEPDRPPVARPPGQLGGAQDRGRCGRLDECACPWYLRRPADAARVEDLRFRVEEAERLTQAILGKTGEDLAAFSEEGSLFLEEGLERREVHHRGVDLDLPEVGIHRGAQRHVARKPVFQIETGAAERACTIVERIAGAIRFDELSTGRHIRKQLDVPRSPDVGHAFETRHPRGQAVLVARREDQPGIFVAPLNDPFRVEAPREPRRG